jgi:ribosome-binding factor A
MSQRTDKVASIVQQTVARLLPEVLHDNIAQVSVTGVDVSPDLRHATVWIDVLGEDKDPVMATVLAARPRLQQELGQVLATKYVPRLNLRLDTGGDYAEHISELMRGL